MSASIEEFFVLKLFALNGQINKAPIIRHVKWVPLYADGLSVTQMGSSNVPLILLVKVQLSFDGCFASYFGNLYSLHVELLVAMKAIENVHQRGWHNFWLECDFSLVVLAFSSLKLVPWKLRTRWKNCLYLTSNIRFTVSHIYRKENSCTEKLANFRVNSYCFTWWDLIPSFLSEGFYRDRFGLPNFRFIQFLLRKVL